MAVMVGQKAPEFELEGVVGKDFRKVKLSDYRGRKWVVLFFYPLDFTFVCPTEIREFSRREGEFAREECQVLGASIDSKFSHLAWIEHGLGALAYPLLSDLTKKTAREYGILKEDLGAAYRATFIIDPEGTIRWLTVSDLGVGRSVDETLRALQALKTGELCPVGWKPGEAFLK